LRDYGIAGQLGMEASLGEYLDVMVEVFREVRRVLRKDGTLWLNLGDSYAAGKTGRADHGSGDPTSRLGPDRDGLPNGTIPGPVFQRLLVNGLKPKDLIGIPWRVAFALQAPDYLGHIHNETDRAWLAALIDGEGCISILETTSGRESGPVSTSYPPILQVRMCDREMIDKAMSLVGSNGESPAQYPPSQGGIRPAYQWRIHGRKAADTIAEIYPFLLIKRKQAIIAWNHQAAREGYETKRGVRIPVDAIEKQKLCRDLIQQINQKETVDLPSWMVEPPQPIGPGWYLRQDLIWSKPNPMPESVTDRCTKAHEYIFLLSKSERYFYDADAIAEPLAESTVRIHSSAGVNARGTGADWKQYNVGNGHSGLINGNLRDGTRNKRSVWEVTTQPFSEAHFATFPPALIEPCILAGCPKECCAKCGAPHIRQVEKTTEFRGGSGAAGRIADEVNASGKWAGKQYGTNIKLGPCVSTETIGWSPSCFCNAGVVAGTVLDPFAGAGTTGLVADRLQRNAILIELNPEYAAMSERRIVSDAPLFVDVRTNDYDGVDDFARSIDECYREIRERKAKGGKGWGGWE
jgi:DNA modification methylase